MILLNMFRPYFIIIISITIPFLHFPKICQFISNMIGASIFQHQDRAVIDMGCIPLAP